MRRQFPFLLVILLLIFGCGPGKVEPTTPAARQGGALDVSRVRFDQEEEMLTIAGSSRLPAGTSLQVVLDTGDDAERSQSLEAQAAVGQGGDWELRLILPPALCGMLRQGQSFRVRVSAADDPQTSDQLWFSVTPPQG